MMAGEEEEEEGRGLREGGGEGSGTMEEGMEGAAEEASSVSCSELGLNRLGPAGSRAQGRSVGCDGKSLGGR